VSSYVIIAKFAVDGRQLQHMRTSTRRNKHLLCFH